MGLNDTALTVDPLILHIDDRIKAASKKASDEISAISQDNLEEIFNSYMQSIDGITDASKIKEQESVLKSEKKIVANSATPTHLQTKELIETSNSILELARNRGMSKGTIIKHLSILKEQEPDLNLNKFMPDEKILTLIKDAIANIKTRNNQDDFSEDGRPRLKPIFEALNAKVEYDDIRILITNLAPF